jgi:hypothetical protein
MHIYSGNNLNLLQRVTGAQGRLHDNDRTQWIKGGIGRGGQTKYFRILVSLGTHRFHCVQDGLVQWRRRRRCRRFRRALGCVDTTVVDVQRVVRRSAVPHSSALRTRVSRVHRSGRGNKGVGAT